MAWRCAVYIVYGLIVVWTGLLRSVEAQAFKPNAFWFCAVAGIVALGTGHLFQMGWSRTARGIGLVVALIVLAFYTTELMTDPAGNATYRVALAIVASCGAICVATLPPAADR